MAGWDKSHQYLNPVCTPIVPIYQIESNEAGSAITIGLLEEMDSVPLSSQVDATLTWVHPCMATVR